jgi:hypothetical protein
MMFALDSLGLRRCAGNPPPTGSADEYDNRFRNDVLQLFESVDEDPIDVVLCATFAVPAIRNGTTDSRRCRVPTI